MLIRVTVPIGSDGQVVPPGAYALYHSGDNHRNPEIYTDPEKWDPARYEKGREEDKAAPYGFTGWGAGRHPCSEFPKPLSPKCS